MRRIVISAGIAALTLGLNTAAGSALGAVPSNCSASGATATVGAAVSCTFSYTGAEQTWAVPDGVTAIAITAVGAPGAAADDVWGHALASGGRGATVTATVPLPEGTTDLYVEVGGPGRDVLCTAAEAFNGGGSSPCGGGGGGASDVRLEPASTALTTSDTRLVVAGGGGGASYGSGFSYATCARSGGQAGDGTVTGGGRGGNGGDYCDATAGGNGGFGCCGGDGGWGSAQWNYGPGGGGSLGQGGDASAAASSWGGGGGGGYYGGGAGGAGTGNVNWPGAGGGGAAGSSYWIPEATATSMSPDTTGTPKVVISYQSSDTAPAAPGAPSSNQSANANGNQTISWPAATDSDGDPVSYTLQHKNSSANASWSSVASALSASSYHFGTDGASENEGTWSYRVIAVDEHGNASDPSTASSAVVVDKTAPNPPTLTADASASQSPSWTDSSTGIVWFKDSELIDVADNGDPPLADGSAGSGVDPSSYPSSFSVTTNGTSTASQTVKDFVGGESNSGTLTAHVDAASPTVGFTDCPTAPIPIGISRSASWTASDDQSGLATQASGQMSLDTATIGSREVITPAARDEVGHSASANCNYTVVYNAQGFYGLTSTNVVRAGATIKLAFSLDGAPVRRQNDQFGLGVIVAGYPQFTTVDCNSGTPTGSPATTATGVLSYNSREDTYTYAWKTGKKDPAAGTCVRFTIVFDDASSGPPVSNGTSLTTTFKFR